MTEKPRKESLATRRGVLAGVGLAGVASAVTACGSLGASGNSAGASGIAGKAGTELATTGQIPVGGGKIFDAQQVVVTQPTSGEYKAFSAICTHMGCLVNQISNGIIICPCHGSQYSITNGAVLGGPAPLPLPAENIKISGDKIILE